jgi:hypothetical protein
MNTVNESTYSQTACQHQSVKAVFSRKSCRRKVMTNILCMLCGSLASTFGDSVMVQTWSFLGFSVVTSQSSSRNPSTTIPFSFEMSTFDRDYSYVDQQDF